METEKRRLRQGLFGVCLARAPDMGTIPPIATWESLCAQVFNIPYHHPFDHYTHLLHSSRCSRAFRISGRLLPRATTWVSNPHQFFVPETEYPREHTCFLVPP